MTENFAQSSAYAYGMIQGIKLTLQKMAEKINTSPLMYRGSLRTELEILISAVNEFPVVAEKGKFSIDTFEGMPVFEWYQLSKAEMLDNLLSE